MLFADKPMTPSPRIACRASGKAEVETPLSIGCGPRWRPSTLTSYHTLPFYTALRQLVQLSSQGLARHGVDAGFREIIVSHSHGIFTNRRFSKFREPPFH